MATDAEKAEASATMREMHQSEDAMMYRDVIPSDTQEDLQTKGLDINDMYRLGKKQEFKRIFRVSTMFMFTSLVQATW